MEAGITAECLQAKGGQQPQKAKRKAWDGFPEMDSPSELQKESTLATPWFHTFGSRAVTEEI